MPRPHAPTPRLLPTQLAHYLGCPCWASNCTRTQCASRLFPVVCVPLCKSSVCGLPMRSRCTPLCAMSMGQSHWAGGGGVRRLHLCLSSGYQSSLPLRPFLLVLVFSLWILLRFSGFVFAFKRVDGIILAVSGNTALVFGIFSIFSLGCTLHVLAIWEYTRRAFDCFENTQNSLQAECLLRCTSAPLSLTLPSCLSFCSYLSLSFSLLNY